MNQFKKIQQEIQEKKKKNTYESTTHSVNNVRTGNLSIPLEKLKKKAKKQEYIFSLYPEE